MIKSPLSGEQLRQADGYCPVHGTALLMEEYGNPDSDMLCKECEAERKQNQAYRDLLVEEQIAEARDNEEPSDYTRNDDEYYESQQYLDRGWA